MLKNELKQIVKQIPGARKFAGMFRIGGHGGWLYKQRTISWMYDPVLNRQLPPLYRLFVAYCAFQKRFSSRASIWGGPQVFGVISRLTHLFSLKDTIQLKLPEYTVYLYLLYPRFLQVPNGLLSSHAETAILASFLSEGDTFIDVGANYGSFSIIATRLVGARGLVVSVEPQPRIAKLLEESLASNAWCAYKMYQIACGDRNGQVEFYIPKQTSGSAGIFSAYSAARGYGKIIVPLRRFDDAVDWRKFPGQVFLKIDIEGSEYSFLNGSSEMIRTRKPIIMLEVNPISMRVAHVTGDAFKQLLHELGYTYFVNLKIPAERLCIKDLDTTRQHDIIALPSEPS